jgi:hypothetical protein
MILFIENNVEFHYEIIETIILNYNKIIVTSKISTIYLSVLDSNISYMKYIKKKYPNIHFSTPNEFNYYISCTIYDNDYDKLIKNSNKYFYISHVITDRLKKLSNVFFLTPLANKYIIADKLPYIENKIKSDIPIYIIQGNITNDRRNYKLLEKILEKNYEHDYVIKLVGRGNLPKELEKYSDKIKLRNNLNFIDYHREFLDTYCILPLITKKTHSQYYDNKLTSSINYCIGYNLKCIIDKDLQEIYKLNDVEIFNDENDIVIAFRKTLNNFYDKN